MAHHHEVPVPPGETRTETDTFGPIEVPANRYYGAQTARSMFHFNIGIPTGEMNNAWHGESFCHQRWFRSNATSLDRSIWPIEESLCDGEYTVRLGQEGFGRHRTSLRWSDCWQTQRTLSSQRLANRIRHSNEHERQWGGLEPCHRNLGRQDGQ